MATQTGEVRPVTPYDRIGGREMLQRIADRFYDLMDEDPAYSRLRAMHAPDLTHMRGSLTGFLSGWSGGPRDWFDANPGKCMMSMHKLFAIDADIAGQWAAAMRRAIADVAPADGEIAEALADVLSRMALGMANA